MNQTINRRYPHLFPKRGYTNYPDAWIGHPKAKIGYEIPLGRHFYVYLPPRAL